MLKRTMRGVGVALLLSGLVVLGTGCFHLTGIFRIINESASAVLELNISPTTDDQWGENWLEGPLAAGAQIDLEAPAGTYDIRAIFADTGIGTVFDVALEANSTVTVTLQEKSLSISDRAPKGCCIVEWLKGLV